MQSHRLHQRADLVRIATHAMTERGLEPEFSHRVEQQLATQDHPRHSRVRPEHQEQF